MDEKKLSADSTRAYMFALKSQSGIKPNCGGYVLKHKPSCYGIAIKWLIYVRGMTFAQFAKNYNGTTAQNINHMINRLDESRFYAEEIDKICEVLGVEYDYFVELSKRIKMKMEA